MASEAEARRLMTTVMSAVVEPSFWPTAMDEIARFFGGATAIAEFHSLDRKKVIIGPRGNALDPKRIAVYLEHYAATCPRSTRMMKRGVPAVQTERMIGTEAELDRHPYYADFLRSDGFRYHMALRLQRRGEMVDALAIQRLARDGDASEDEIAWMYELAPFLRSAFEARALLGEHALGEQGLVGALARMEAPVIFLAADGRVLFQNEAASAVPAEERSVDWASFINRWRTAGVLNDDGHPPAVALAGGRWSARLLEIGRVVDPPALGGVYVVRLERRTASAVLPRRGLTMAESAVLRYLVAGLSPAEIARTQKVSLATVRTHVARLHEKFGVGRTLDLVRIAMTEGIDRP